LLNRDLKAVPMPGAMVIPKILALSPTATKDRAVPKSTTIQACL